MLPNNPWTVCLEVQKYLQAKYDIDFITSRTKIFPLAKKLKGKDADSIEETAENLYRLYKNDKRENMTKGIRLTNKESKQMLDNEIFQSEERTSKLVKELDDLRIVGMDISHLPDQSSVIYVSSNRVGDVKYERGL